MEDSGFIAAIARFISGRSDPRFAHGRAELPTATPCSAIGSPGDRLGRAGAPMSCLAWCMDPFPS
jgi:hypothetical protein